MNSFDVVVSFALIVAIIFGFRAGLLRSLAVIFGYLLAMPIAIWTASLIAPELDGKLGAPWMQTSIPCFAIFLIAGVVLGKLLQIAVNEMVESDIGLLDRVAGGVLGAVRVGLVAITFVLIFDQIVPPDLQPAYLSGSQLRPIFSRMGQTGFRALPPDVTATIDQWKRDRHL
ncbi:MAG: CvpA family protein [Proteobacteria bacterium]|nr:CvpA family protein [Pseudomonadota bacterium]